MRESTLIAAGACVVLLAVAPAAMSATDPQICADASGEVAIEACNRAINSGQYSGSQLANSYYNRAIEYYNKLDFDRSISDLDQAIRLRPDYALAYAARGNAWSEKKEPRRAVPDYDQALRLDSTLTAAYTGRGMERQVLGDIEGAVSDYRAALASPQKRSNDQWAHDTARARLKQLGY